MIAFVTGHRPPKLGGYDFANPTRTWCREQLKKFCEENEVTVAVSGMALGADQDFVLVLQQLKIPLIAAVPCDDQERLWPESSQKTYRKLLEYAEYIKIVGPGPYSAKKMLDRNKWMVDHATIGVAVWNGTTGGTSHCVHYALEQKKKMYRINPDTKKCGWM